MNHPLVGFMTGISRIFLTHGDETTCLKLTVTGIYKCWWFDFRLWSYVSFRCKFSFCSSYWRYVIYFHLEVFISEEFIHISLQLFNFIFLLNSILSCLPNIVLDCLVLYISAISFIFLWRLNVPCFFFKISVSIMFFS